MTELPMHQCDPEQVNGKLLESCTTDERQLDDNVQIVKHNRTHRTHCTRLEKRLSWATVVLFLISAVFILVICLLLLKKPEVCMTRHCVRTSAALMASIDPNVDPCEDFYTYACGNWIRNHPIPDDRASISNFEQRQIDLEHALRQLFDNRTKEPYSAIEKVKQFYRLCTNETQISTSWRATFDRFAKNLSGWPVLTPDWRQPAYGVERIFGTLVLHHSEESLFKFSVGPDDKASDENVVQIDQANLMLGIKDTYISPEAADELAAYRKLMISTVMLMGVKEADAKREMEDVLQFEIALAKETIFDETRINTAVIYWKVNVSYLSMELQNFNWTDFLGTVFPGRQIEPGMKIVAYCKEFLYGLNRILPKWKLRTVTNYLIWRWFARSVLPYLPNPYAQAYYEFQTSLGQLQTPQLRWHGCVKLTNSLLQDATGAMYIRSHFDERSKNHASEMILMLMDAFEELLEENDWLTPAVRLSAAEKARKMLLKIAYPDYFTNLIEVDRMYESYIVYEQDFYASKFGFELQNNRISLDQLGMPVNRTKWETGVAVVNAFYNPNANEITLPAAILLPVFFSDTYPWSMNFGGIGVVIGHEITHGFDDKGRHYDKNGNIREWWDNETVHNFEHRAQCIEDQYNFYDLKLKEGKIRINGKMTKGENIADNGGLKQAFRAYKNYVTKYGQEPKLPGLDYTHEQLFFLNYAQIWCGSMNDKESVRKVRSSVHSPGPIRVLGPLSNLKDFSKAFKCNAGSKMNPASKQQCKVW